MTSHSLLLEELRHGLVVSCQADEDSPLYGASTMALFAQAAVKGGAVGIRARGAADVAAISGVVDVPVIGLTKRGRSGVYITPTVEDALALQDAGASLVAVDATLRPRPDGSSTEDFIRELKRTLTIPVVADVDSVDAGILAESAGADVVATTLSGYVAQSPAPSYPDLALVGALAKVLRVPVFAEGRYSSKESAIEALAAGAHTVVVGGAITDPVAITRRYVEALRGARRG